jgi:putative toxin-antitoxin system antitoxin component (TIGR02293 family)
MAKRSKTIKGARIILSNNNPVNTDVIRWLGGQALIKFTIRSDFDYITMGNEGLTKGSLDELAQALGVSRKVMAEQIFDVSVKTLERKTPKERLDKKTSSHAIEIAKVLHHAYEVFQDNDKIKHWLNTPNSALKGKSPLSLLDTMTGMHMVDDILGRIQEGVYS